MKALTREIKKLCKGTDRELVQLKKKYASNAAVMQRLNEFEEGIEAQEVPAMQSTKAGHRAG